MSKENISDNLVVDIVYRNKSMETVGKKTYSLDEYVKMMGLEIRRIILDVEDLVYRLQDGRQKDEWSDQAVSGFSRIRHKLLDKAGDIDRLPRNIREREESDDVEVEKASPGKEFETVEEFVRSVFNQ